MGFFTKTLIVSFCFCVVILLMIPSETDRMKTTEAPVDGSMKEGADEVTVFHFATKAQGEKYSKEEDKKVTS